MKRFVRNIILFSLPILALLAVAECYVRSMDNPARYKHEWMKQHSREVETLVLGSSHTFYGVDVSMLGANAFSLAQPTQPYRYDYYELTHYDLPRLRTVILPFSYQSLFEDLESEPRLRYWAVRYRLYMDCNIHSPLSEYGFECLQTAPFKEKLTSLWRPSLLSWDSLGFGTSYGETSLLSEGFDNGRQRAEENTYPDRANLRFCTAQLDSIASFCDRRNVRLILLTTPVAPSFRQYADKEQKHVGDSTLQQILRRHPSASHLDFWADTTFSAADFYDADHLNAQGAKKLTSKLRLSRQNPQALR